MKTVYKSIHENTNVEAIVQDYSMNEIQVFSVIYRNEGVSLKGGLGTSAQKFKLMQEGYEDYKGELAYVYLYDELTSI
ncbi:MULTISPECIES: hypothetical protein [unclassified Psychrobacillus]|uniref:hypothetical protein n=1 Tax=unclassified Psychrobacillus TaxID=2636677 RepID=UPI0030FBE5F5